MAPIRNARHIFNEIPTGDDFIPGRTAAYDASRTIDLDNVLLRGGILVKNLFLSIDLYLKDRMSDIPMPRANAQLGEPLDNVGVGVILRSENPNFKPGDHVRGFLRFEEYSVHAPIGFVVKIENKHNLPWSLFLGILGLPGQTAYCSWKEYAHAKKTTNTSEVLQQEGPIDVYWDNVGGEILDAALQAAALHGRFIMCGTVSKYTESYPLNVSGFMVLSIFPKYQGAFDSEVPALIASGELKYQEHTWGLESAGETVLGVLKGTNAGKILVAMGNQ